MHSIRIPTSPRDALGKTRTRLPRESVQRDHSGFTLVEVIVVILIMGILAATAAPTFYRSLVYHRVESAARRLKTDLEQLRHLARVKSQGQSLNFVNSTTYTLSGGVQDLDHAGIAYSVDLAKPPYDLDSVTSDYVAPAAVSFDGYGRPYLGGSFSLQIGDQQRIVTVDGNTGHANISGE